MQVERLGREERALNWLCGTTAGARGLSREVIEKYRVGAAEYSFRQPDGSFRNELCVTFPWIELQDDEERLMRLKVQLHERSCV